MDNHILRGKNMDKNDILKAVYMLACSQGFYGRLYMELQENEGLLDYLVEQNFKDTLDMVFFLEG